MVVRRRSVYTKTRTFRVFMIFKRVAGEVNIYVISITSYNVSDCVEPI